MAKKKKRGIGGRIGEVILGAILVFGGMIPVSASLFGQTGHITEITSSQRFGGALRDGSLPNTYKWDIGYKFKMKNGEYETGSVTVNGDAVSSKSGLRAGSPVRYLAFYPGFNTPGGGGFDVSTMMYVLCVGIGVLLIWFGVRKETEAKTPSQRSREYRAAKAAEDNQPPPPPVKKKPTRRAKTAAAVNNSGGDNKMFCKNCGTESSAGANFCKSCGANLQTGRQAPAAEPDWDSFEYDDETPITEAEADELYGIATEEEVADEFDLINSGEAGPAYYRKVLPIVRWRRANGQ
jgi:hypothetical protein